MAAATSNRIKRGIGFDSFPIELAYCTHEIDGPL